MVQRQQRCCFASFRSVNLLSVHRAASGAKHFPQQISDLSSARTGKRVAELNDESGSRVAPNVVPILTIPRWINAPVREAWCVNTTNDWKIDHKGLSERCWRRCWFCEKDFSWAVCRDNSWHGFDRIQICWFMPRKNVTSKRMKDPRRMDGFGSHEHWPSVGGHEEWWISILDCDQQRDEQLRQWASGRERDICPLRRSGRQYGEMRCDKTEGTIHSTIIFTLNDCCADRSTKVEWPSCRWPSWWGVFILQCLEVNDPYTTASRSSSRSRLNNVLEHIVTYVMLCYVTIILTHQDGRIRCGQTICIEEATRKISVCLNFDRFILYMRAIQGHSGGNKIKSSLLYNWEIPYTWTEYICHVGSSLDLHSILHSRVDRRKRIERKKTNSILHSREAYDWFSRRWITRRDKTTKGTVQN